jgi:hypothetical protein
MTPNWDGMEITGGIDSNVTFDLEPSRQLSRNGVLPEKSGSPLNRANSRDESSSDGDN